MERDALSNLLRQADAGACPTPHARGDVAGLVRQRHARRQRRRARLAAAGCTASVLLVAVASLWRFARPAADGGGGGGGGHPVVASATNPAAPAAAATAEDLARLRSELARLRHASDLHESTAQLVQDGEQKRRRAAGPSRERRRRAPAAALDPLLELRWQREQAALVLVRQGDRLAQEMNLPQPAELAYRFASETFPGTHWASVAQSRLLPLSER